MQDSYDPDLREYIIRSTCDQVSDAAFQSDPFPHVLVCGFLPADVYEQLQRCFPPLEHFEPFDYEKHRTTDGDSNRLRFQTNDASLGQLDDGSRRFWYSLRSALASEELRRTVYRKLAPGLTYRYRVPEEEVEGLAGYALPEVFQETDGYRIKPHPDTRKKVVTMQLALPEDESQRPFGTEFYRRSMQPGDWFREPRGFEVVKRMPFLPNTAYAFTVLNTIGLKSWHGRTVIDGSSGVRRSLLNIWYERAEKTYPELVRENQAIYGRRPPRSAAA